VTDDELVQIEREQQAARERADDEVQKHGRDSFWGKMQFFFGLFDMQDQKVSGQLAGFAVAIKNACPLRATFRKFGVVSLIGLLLTIGSIIWATAAQETKQDSGIVETKAAVARCSTRIVGIQKTATDNKDSLASMRLETRETLLLTRLMAARAGIDVEALRLLPEPTPAPVPLPDTESLWDSLPDEFERLHGAEALGERARNED